MNKKAQAMDMEKAPYLVLTFIILIFVIGVGVLAISGFRNAQLSATVSRSDTNTTFTAIKDSAVSFDTDQGGTLYIANSCSNVNIYNASNAANVTSTYTISGCKANLTAANQNNTVPTATFSYSEYTETAAYNATAESPVVNISNQLGTVGTIMGIALILTIVIGAFYFVLHKNTL